MRVDDDLFHGINEGLKMFEIFLCAAIAAVLVLGASALMIAGVLFIDRRDYVRKNGMDPLRVIVPAKQPKAKEFQPAPAPVSNDSEWI